MNDDSKNVRKPPPLPPQRPGSPTPPLARVPRVSPPPIPDTARPKRAAPRSRPRDEKGKPPGPPPPPTGEEGLDDPTTQFGGDAEHEHLETRRVPRSERHAARPLVDADEAFTAVQAFLKQELQHVGEEDRRGRAILLCELGQIKELVFQEMDQALAHYEEAFAVDPSLVPCIRALRRRYRQEKRWRDVLKVLEAEVAITAEEGERSELMVEMGELLVTRFSDTEAAIKCLKAALKLIPGQRRAAELLRDIYARLEHWEDLLEVLRGIANVTRDSLERARILGEMAEVCEHHLGRAAEAEDLYTQCLELDPSSEAATVALRRLYLAHRRWKDLRELLAKEAGRDHDPDERFADLYRAARISELHLQDDVQAASLLETAAALRPSDPLPLQALTAIYQRTGRYEDLAAVLSRQLRLVRDAADRATLCYRLGRACEDWLDRPEDAVRSYREALKEQPGHEAALRALANLYQRFERWEDLLDLELLRAERSRDVARRADGYVRAAYISEWQVHDLRRAVDLYDRAYRMMPGLPEAFRALERIYRRSTRWEALAELYEREAEATKDSALAVGLLRSAARLYEESLDKRDRAITTLEKLLKRSADDRETLIHLSRLYEEVGRVEDLRRSLERWSEVTEDDRERTELSRRIGELLEGPLRRTEQAVDVYRKILERVPSDRPTMERLKAIFERTGRWKDLVDLLRAELKVISAGPDQAPVLVQIGQIARDKLGDTEQAQAAFTEALKADANHTPALQAVQELLEGQGLWERLVNLLGTIAERTREPARAAATLCAAGEACEEQLREPTRAEEFYNRALELDPANGPARHGLERLYLASGDQSALEAHYLREAEGTTNPLLRLRAYLRLGSLFNAMANDPVGAAAAFESALRVVEDQPDALRSLAVIHRKTMNWERLAGVLARIAGTSNDPNTAVSALKEWASIVELHLSEQWDPAPIYERVLDGVPYDGQALFALDCIAHERGATDVLVSLAMRQVKKGGNPDLVASLCTRSALLLLAQDDVGRAAEMLRRGLQASHNHLPAVQLLRRLDESLEEWGEAADLLLREGDLVCTPGLAHAGLVRAANILLDRFGDIVRARATFERVFSEDPSNAAAFGRLAGILASTQEWNSLVAAYQRRMQALDRAARIPLQLELASLFRDSLRDTTAAIEVLQELLSVDPNHRQALTEISELCAMQHRWREAEGYLEQLALVAQSEHQAARAALLQRAQILEEQLGEEDQALEVLAELLADYPGDNEALARCLEIHRRRGDWERTVEVLEELSRSGQAHQRVNNLVDLAELYSRTLNDMDAAHSSLRRAAMLCVETGEGVDRIIEYHERRGDFEGVVAFLGEALEGLPPEGSPGAVNVRLARARILAGRLLQPSDAEFEIRRALQSDPNSVAARLELAGLHLWGDNLGEATTEYMRILDQDPFCMEAYRGLYRVYDRRGDVERAAGAAQVVVAVAGREVPERKIAAQATAPMEAALSSAVATPLGVGDFWNLLAHPDEPQVARELLYLVADYIPAIVPHEVDVVTGGNIIPLAPGDRLADRCAQLAQVLGVDRLEVCLGKGRPSAIAALPGNPPRLVVDEGFATHSSAGEFRFAAGRALADILTRSLYLAALQPRTAELLLAAVASLFERGYGEHLNQAHEVEELSRAVGRVIPRKVRRVLEEPARAYAVGQPVIFKTWYTAAQRSAERAGLLLGGDVEAALAVLRQEKAPRSVQAELLRFTVGPHLYEARRRLGLSI